MRRPEKMAEALKEEIAEVVGFELEDPRVEAVTVTDVKVSDDLRDAKVYENFLILNVTSSTAIELGKVGPKILTALKDKKIPSFITISVALK